MLLGAVLGLIGLDAWLGCIAPLFLVFETLKSQLTPNLPGFRTFFSRVPEAAGTLHIQVGENDL